MSAEKTSYLLYGFKVEDRGKLKILENMYDNLMETPPCSNIFNSTKSDQTIVWDVMCGKYVYVGILIAKKDEWDESGTEIDEKQFDFLKYKLKEYMYEWPEDLFELLKCGEPKLHFFIRYS